MCLSLLADVQSGQDTHATLDWKRDMTHMQDRVTSMQAALEALLISDLAEAIGLYVQSSAGRSWGRCTPQRFCHPQRPALGLQAMRALVQAFLEEQRGI